jgi:TonB-dependent receptor
MRESSRPEIMAPGRGRVSVNTGLDEPFLAAQTVDAAYGKFDVTWNNAWRLAAGVRWEQFNQAAVPFNPLEFSVRTGQSSSDPETLARSVLQTDKLYPSLALTWMATDFMGADDFQFRLGYSQTVARPDLREISPAVYIDPLTESRIFGNNALVPSDLRNWDARAEWFFPSGDNFTLSAFYKDIDRPIETVQFAGSDDNSVLTFVNADQGKVYGVELEGLKYLGFASDWVGDWVSAFFVSGNLTLSDSEITIGENALSLTNQRRRLTQHSQWVLNMQIGYDSPDERHSASLIYNVYGDRIFSAGRNGAADAFEEPIHTVDFVYSFYPTERFTVSARAQNLLNEKRQILQSSPEFGPVSVFEQLIGTTLSGSVKWSF